MRFKLFGTEIYISFLFSAMLTVMLCFDRTGYIIPAVSASLLHEVGHLFCMWLSGCAPISVKIIPSSIQIVKKFNSKPVTDIIIALSGPLFNIALFLSFYFLYLNFQNKNILIFALINLLIGLFNLMPIKGLDGGTVLFALLNRKSVSLAEKTLNIITYFSSAILLCFGFFTVFKGNTNISVFIMAIYLIICVIVKI